MITLYSNEGCGSCMRVKTELRARSIPYNEVIVGKDITNAELREQFPGKKILPILVTETAVYSGPTEILPVLNEYKSDVGKELLTENNNKDIGRFVNEGGLDPAKDI